MSRERNFRDYYLGDNVYELANELIPEIADRLEVDLGDEPSAEALGRLVGVVGKNKVLRENEEVRAYDVEEAAELVERSGVQRPLSRSLWTPEIGLVGEDKLAATIVTGAVANWMDRTARLVGNSRGSGTVYAVMGNRVMSTATEITNPNVMKFQATHGRAPTEGEYAVLIMPRMGESDHLVFGFSSFDTANGDELAAQFVEKRPDLFKPGQKLSFAKVANAGIQLAVQFRKAARSVNPDYDRDPTKPQVFVQTDTFPIARTADQVANPREFQSPFTALRQVALTAKLLHEAANE